MNGGTVYIMSNVHRTVFYVGVALEIKKRVWQHKSKARKGFTAKYNCTDLLYYFSYFDMDEAMTVEKRIKRWKREFKINLIKQNNPDMIDLAKGWYDSEGNIIE